jgi:hypothetical protein
LSDKEFDTLVVRELSRLPAHAPSRGFADRVMARVQLPQPRAVVLWRRARAWALEPRRAFVLAGAYAAAASIGLILAVPWVLQQAPALGAAVDWVAARVAGGVRELALDAAGWMVASGVAARMRDVSLSATQLWAGGILFAVAYAGCAFGLHRLLRAPKVAHASVRVDA